MSTCLWTPAGVHIAQTPCPSSSVCNRFLHASSPTPTVLPSSLRYRPFAHGHRRRRGASCPRALRPRNGLSARCAGHHADVATAAPVWQDPQAPWYALAWRARRDASGPHGGRRAAGLGGGKPLAWTYDPCQLWNGRAMKGTRFAQFSTEVLRRGAAAVLPQHLPDRWLDALLEEADLLASGGGRPGQRLLRRPPGGGPRAGLGATRRPARAGAGREHPL
jgi:hypothetical protein